MGYPLDPPGISWRQNIASPREHRRDGPAYQNYWPCVHLWTGGPWFEAEGNACIPGGVTRLDRIVALIQSCHYSLHDLSRVELDLNDPPTPRFNMPLDLGMSVAWAKMNSKQHMWFVFESCARRAQKSISDLNGTDCNIHGGTDEGVMRELCSAFVRRSSRTTVPQMLVPNASVKRGLPTLMRKAAAASVFEARIFEDVVVLAVEVREHVTANRPRR